MTTSPSAAGFEPAVATHDGCAGPDECGGEETCDDCGERVGWCYLGACDGDEVCNGCVAARA